MSEACDPGSEDDSIPLTVVVSDQSDLSLSFYGEIVDAFEDRGFDVLLKRYNQYRRIEDMENDVVLFIVAPYSAGTSNRVIRRFQRKLDAFAKDSKALRLRYSVLPLPDSGSESRKMHDSLTLCGANSFVDELDDSVDFNEIAAKIMTAVSLTATAGDDATVAAVESGVSSAPSTPRSPRSGQFTLNKCYLSVLVESYAKVRRRQVKASRRKRSIRLRQHLDTAAPVFTLAYGTETGNSLEIAKQIAEVGVLQRPSCVVKGPMQLNQLASKDSFNQLSERKILVIVCSTTGDGEVPESAQRFWRKLKLKLKEFRDKSKKKDIQSSILIEKGKSAEKSTVINNGVHSSISERSSLISGSVASTMVSRIGSSLASLSGAASSDNMSDIGFVGGGSCTPAASLSGAGDGGSPTPVAPSILSRTSPSVSTITATATATAGSSSSVRSSAVSSSSVASSLPIKDESQKIKPTKSSTRKTRFGWLEGVHYCILGLGDSNYSQFNMAARKLDDVLNLLGATKIYQTGFADDATGLEDVVEPWKVGCVKEIRRLWPMIVDRMVQLTGSEASSQRPSLMKAAAGISGEGSTTTTTTTKTSSTVLDTMDSMEKAATAAKMRRSRRSRTEGAGSSSAHCSSSLLSSKSADMKSVVSEEEEDAVTGGLTSSSSVSLKTKSPGASDSYLSYYKGADSTFDLRSLGKLDTRSIPKMRRVDSIYDGLVSKYPVSPVGTESSTMGGELTMSDMSLATLITGVKAYSSESDSGAGTMGSTPGGTPSSSRRRSSRKLTRLFTRPFRMKIVEGDKAEQIREACRKDRLFAVRFGWKGERFSVDLCQLSPTMSPAMIAMRSPVSTSGGISGSPLIGGSPPRRKESGSSVTMAISSASPPRIKPTSSTGSAGSVGSGAFSFAGSASSSSSSKRPFLATLSQAKFLTTIKCEFDTLHLALRLPSGVKYRTGDVVCIHVPNNEYLMRKLMDRLNLDGNTVISIQAISEALQRSTLPHIYTPATLDYIFRFCIDLRTVPSKMMVQSFSEYCSKDEDQLAMQELAEQSALSVTSRGTVLDLLEQFPSCVPSLEIFLAHMPPLKPRSYSITSSPNVYPDSIHIAFRVLETEHSRSSRSTKRSRHRRWFGKIPGGRDPLDGLCTTWLYDLCNMSGMLASSLRRQCQLSAHSPAECGCVLSDAVYGYRLCHESKRPRIPCYLKSATKFTLPTMTTISNKNSDDKCDLLPLIMIGPGTGVAPFRAFLQERAYRKSKLGSTMGPAYLFFGCRDPNHDFLYKQDWTDFINEGVLTELVCAFSRVSDRKVYVSDKLKEYGKIVSELIVHHQGLVYVCGDASSMSKSVQLSLTELLALHEEWTVEQSEKYLRKMQKDGRYNVDVWTSSNK